MIASKAYKRRILQGRSEISYHKLRGIMENIVHTWHVDISTVHYARYSDTTAANQTARNPSITISVYFGQTKVV